MKKQVYAAHILVIAILSLSFLTSCKKEQQNQETATNQNQRTVQTTAGVVSDIWRSIQQDTTPFVFQCESIDGKPVATYWLENTAIDYDAIRYYLGDFTPAEDTSTARLLEKIAVAHQTETPFYFHVLTQLLKQSDGAVAQMLPAQTEKFVREHAYFFAHYLTDKTHAGRKEITELYAQFIQTALAQQKIDVTAWKEQLINTCKQCNEDEKQVLGNFAAMLSR